MNDQWVMERGRMQQQLVQAEQRREAQKLYVIERLRQLRVKIDAKIATLPLDDEEAREAFRDIGLTLQSIQQELRQ